MRGPGTTAADDVTPPAGSATRGAADRAGSPGRLCHNARADHGPDRLAGARGAWCLVFCLSLAAVPAGAADAAPVVDGDKAADTAGDEGVAEGGDPGDVDAGTDRGPPGGTDDNDDDGTRPVRGDLPARAGPSRPRPDATAAQDPTFAIWSRSFAFMCGTQFATLIGCIPGLFVVFIGGEAVNELGAKLTGRQGTAATTVAMFGGGAVALLVSGASTLVGLGIALSGDGGSGLLIPFGLAGRGTVAAGAGVAVAGLVGGAALGALLPTAAWLNTAEPVPEGAASW